MLSLRRRLPLLAASVAVAAVVPLAAVPAAAQPPGAMFAAGTVWHGEFADPSILQVGRTYYAYATTTGGDNLPVLTSRNLRTWRARPAYSASANPGWWKGYNDALPHPASWAVYPITRNGRRFTQPWAPSVGRVGDRYVVAYSVPVSTSSARRCISTATSGSPLGPFVDRSTGPIVCSSDPNGSIDPWIWTPPGSTTAYLVWKNAGVPRHAPTTLWTRPLASSGTAFAAGSRAHELLATSQRWEGTVIENPAMIAYAGRDYLFYSAGGYDTAGYAIGYAVCRGPAGPCTKPTSHALLASGGPIAGPGGPAPVLAPDGGLRLGYAAWRTGHVGYPGNERTLHVASLAASKNGLLRVTARG